MFNEEFNPHKGSKASCKCEFMPGVKGKTRIEGYNPDTVYKEWRAAVKIRESLEISEEEAKILLDRLGITKLSDARVDRVISIWKKAIECLKKPLMMSYEDPLADFIGSAERSDPMRVYEMVKKLKEYGVDVKRTGIGGDMAYGPSARSGLAGSFKISDDASIAAWEHEFCHFMDDLELGFPGLSYFIGDTERWVNFERRAYEVEIEIAKQKGYPELEERYRELLAVEMERWAV